MSSKHKLEWTPEATNAAEDLKRLVSEAPFLKRWEPDKPTCIITDASLVGIGAVLEQQHEGRWHPVAF